MRTVPAHITAARQSSSATLTKVWRIERTDGQVFRFTAHDRDLEIDGETFLASTAMGDSAIKSSHDLSVDDLDVQGALDSAAITEEDLLAGRWDGASFLIAEVDWTQPDAGWDVLRWGWLGRVRTVGGMFIVELLGPTVKLQAQLGQIYQASCRATLGDARCKVVLAGYTSSGTVSAVTSNRVFSASGLGSPPSGDDAYWSHGLLTWTAGDNAGLSMEVRTCDGTDVDLMLPMPGAVQVGDTFSLVAGCDHALATCRDRFNNVRNFRGEPHVPVSDDTIKGPV